MINLLKIFQIIIFSLLIFPSIYIFIREPFIKYKKYKNIRLTISGFILSISIIIFMLLSIIITYNDLSYVNLKYAPFIQSWAIIKSSLLAYAGLIVIMTFCMGIYFWSIVITSKRASILKFNSVKPDIPKKLTLKQKLKYPFMYYEMYVNVKKLKTDYYLLSDYANKDLMNFESKEK